MVLLDKNMAQDLERDAPPVSEGFNPSGTEGWARRRGDLSLQGQQQTEWFRLYLDYFSNF